MKEPERQELAPFLEACLIQMQVSREWFAKRVLRLSLDQLRWRPGTGHWSMAECLDHLNLTLAYYLPKIEYAIDEHRAQRGDARECRAIRESEAAFLREVEPPILSAWSTPAALLPVAAVNPDRIIDQFTELRHRCGKTILSASGLDLADISIAGSMHPPIESAGGAMALLAAHDRRHLWQIERVCRMPGFPASP